MPSDFLFGPEDLPAKKPRKKPQRLMHVIDAGQGEDNWHMVVMQCSKCNLKTDWFQVQTITEGKRGIPCPKCNNLKYETNEYNEYVVKEA